MNSSNNYSNPRASLITALILHLVLFLCAGFLAIPKKEKEPEHLFELVPPPTAAPALETEPIKEPPPPEPPAPEPLPEPEPTPPPIPEPVIPEPEPEPTPPPPPKPKPKPPEPRIIQQPKPPPAKKDPPQRLTPPKKILKPRLQTRKPPSIPSPPRKVPPRVCPRSRFHFPLNRLGLLYPEPRLLAPLFPRRSRITISRVFMASSCATGNVHRMASLPTSRSRFVLPSATMEAFGPSA